VGKYLTEREIEEEHSDSLLENYHLFGISRRIALALKRNNVSTFRDISKYPPSELTKLRGIGPSAQKEIENMLKKKSRVFSSSKAKR
jgi:DNA-directed RNA polymerase alpha subunit